MKIAIVLHPFNEKSPAGLGRFILELARELIRIDDRNEYLILTKDRLSAPPRFARSVECFGYGYKAFWLDRTIRRAPKADLYLFNTPVMPLSVRMPRSIVVALDFAYRHFPPKNLREWLSRIVPRLYHGYSLNRADAVVAISRATADDCERLHNVPREKISVIPLGVNRIVDIEPVSVKGLKPPFLLFVGAIKERKNVLRVVEAFDAFFENHPEYELVLAGAGGGVYLALIRDFLKNLPSRSSVKFLGHVSDAELSWLYRNAHALIFPSLVEGFGFPVVEAMHAGLPAVTSNVSSLAELAKGGGAITVDPFDTKAITEAMEKVVSDEAVCERLIQEGHERAKLYTWERAARSYLALFEKLVPQAPK